MSIIALAAVALLSGQSQSAPLRSGSDLTRDLNSGPPSAVAPSSQTPSALPPIGSAPASQPRPTQTPSAQTPSALPPIGSTPASQPRPTETRPTTSGATGLPPIGQGATSPAPTPAPATTPAPSSTPASAPQPPATPATLSADAIAALPFRIELPQGVTMTASRAGADASVYSVRRGDQLLVMIYAGPASQFPIFDGEMVQAGGRASVIVVEGARRLAMEHLFQRATAPREIHVWVASPGGADRDLAERIGQSIDAR